MSLYKASNSINVDSREASQQNVRLDEAMMTGDSEDRRLSALATASAWPVSLPRALSDRTERRGGSVRRPGSAARRSDPSSPWRSREPSPGS